jgi:hypothetical protein
VDDLSIGLDQNGGFVLHTFCIHFVLYALNRANLRINAKKCEFFSRYIIFLGELYDTKLNISTIPVIKAKHFLSWKRPTSQAETCARIGSLSFFRHYLPHFTAVALPLLVMTKSPCFYWGPSQEKAWNELRLLVALQVEISLQDPHMPLVLVSDASHVQLAFSLYELRPGFNLKLIYSDSRVLTPAKANLSSVYREYLSLEFALYKSESYIRQCIPGTIIMSDANSIAFLQYAKSVKPQVQSFVNYMSSFSNIYYSYLPGKFLGLSDVLCREFSKVLIDKEAPSSLMFSTYFPNVHKFKLPTGTTLNPKSLHKVLQTQSSRNLLDMSPNTRLYTSDIKYLKDSFFNPSSREEELINILINPCQDIRKLSNTNLARELLKDSKRWPKNLQKSMIEKLNLKSLQDSLMKVTKNLQKTSSDFYDMYDATCFGQLLPDCNQAIDPLGHLRKGQPDKKNNSVEKEEEDKSLNYKNLQDKTNLSDLDQEEIDSIFYEPILLTGNANLDHDTKRKFQLINKSNLHNLERAYGQIFLTNSDTPNVTAHEYAIKAYHTMIREPLLMDSEISGNRKGEGVQVFNFNLTEKCLLC